MTLFFVEGGRNNPSTQPKAVGIVAVEPNLSFYYIRTIRVTLKKEVKFTQKFKAKKCFSTPLSDFIVKRLVRAVKW